MRGSQLGQGRDNCFELSVKRAGCGTQLQHQAGVEGVLAGGAIVDVTRRVGRSASDAGGELFDERDGEIAGCRHGLREGWQINEFGAAERGNRGGEIFRDQSCPGLRPGESGFKIKNGLDGGGVGEERLNGRRAEEAIQKLHG
jgi:hypothetical protein